MNLLGERPLILASASPRRLALLNSAGFAPEVISAEAVELDGLLPGQGPAEFTVENALRKARAAYARLAPRDAWLLAADTAVVLDGVLFGKPQDAAEARAMLARLSGRQHQVYTGLALLDGLSGAEHIDCSKSEIWFAELSAAEIADYVAGGEPLDKAGAYGLQGAGGVFVRRVEGDPSAVIGLPLSLLREMILQAGKTLPKEKL